MTTPTQAQAQREYAARQARIKALMATISAALDDHAVRAAAQPGDWGFAGDLGHIEQQLQDLASGMGA